jgi:hypothetical protein
MLPIFQLMLPIFQLMLPIFQLMLAVFQLMLAIFQLMLAIFQLMLAVFQLVNVRNISVDVGDISVNVGSISINVGDNSVDVASISVNVGYYILRQVVAARDNVVKTAFNFQSWFPRPSPSNSTRLSEYRRIAGPQVDLAFSAREASFLFRCLLQKRLNDLTFVSYPNCVDSTRLVAYKIFI